MRQFFLWTMLLLLVPTPALTGTGADFTFTDLAGKTYTPAGLKGAPVVVYIGAHW